MKPGRLDIVCALIAGACNLFFLLPDLNFPVWALFFGFTWYFVGGATPKVFKMALLPAIEGYVCAIICAIVYAVTNFNVFALCGIVALCVFIIMITAKKEPFAFTCASFNAFSIFFAGYYSGQFYGSGTAETLAGFTSEIKYMLMAMATFFIANYVGLFAGFLTIALGVPKAQ